MWQIVGNQPEHVIFRGCLNPAIIVDKNDILVFPVELNLFNETLKHLLGIFFLYRLSISN